MIKRFHDPPADVEAAWTGRRLVVIENLTWWVLPIALLLSATRRRVIYLRPHGRLKETSWIDRLQRFGLRMNQFADLPGFNLYGRLVVAEDSAEAVVAVEATPDFLAAVEPLFPPVRDRQAKIRLLLFNALYRPYWDAGNSLALACYYAQAGAKVRVWHPVSPEGVLLHRSGALPARALFSPTVQLVMLAARQFVGLAGRVAMRWKSRQNTAPVVYAAASTPAPDRSPVLFLPHKGIFYGELYEKTQYYVDERGHPLSRHNILHVELPDFMSAAEYAQVVKDYQARGYKHADLRLGLRKLPLRTIADVARALPRFTLNALFLLGGAVVLSRRVDAWRNGLAQFRAARVALVHFEFLVPCALKYALQACGIRVLALQERHISVSRKSHSLILDGYLVQSDRCREWTRANPFSVVDRIDVVGDYHAGHLQRLRATRQQQAQPIVACYDFHSIPDLIDDAQLAFNNWKNNSLFYEAILSAAQRFPRVRFIIHGKDARWMDLPFFQSLVERMAKVSNIEVMRHRALDSGYLLAASADCIVARYTSLVDQAMAAGIPTLVHEEIWRDNRCVAWWRDYDGAPVFVRSRAELIDRLADVIEHKRYMPPEQFQDLRRRYYDLNPETASARSRAAIQRWLEAAGVDLGVSPAMKIA